MIKGRVNGPPLDLLLKTDNRKLSLLQNYVAAGFSLRRHRLESLCY